MASFHSIPLEILDDLGARFIINIPEAEQQDLIRICFQVELAHWFYIDEYVQDNASNYKPKLRSCGMREFAEHMFRHIGFLRGYADNIHEVLEDWRQYKMSVPTYGAIILNEDLSQVLLAQGFCSKSTWSFPKGKVNEDELPHDCAVREVLEETGFDISSRIDENVYLKTVVNDQTVMLFLIPGVPTETKFMPRTRNEIRDLQWFPVADLPNHKKEVMPPNHLNIGPNNLYMVFPFIKNLKKWIGTFKRGHFRRLPSEIHNSSRQTPPIETPKPFKQTQSPSKTLRKQKEQPTQTSEELHCPKIWSNFQFKKNDIFSAMSSIPGWVAQ